MIHHHHFMGFGTGNFSGVIGEKFVVVKPGFATVKMAFDSPFGPVFEFIY